MCTNGIRRNCHSSCTRSTVQQYNALVLLCWYPSYFRARTLPYPPCNAISTTGSPVTRFLPVPGTRFFAGYLFFCRVPGYQGTRHFFLKFFLPTSLPRRMNFEWKMVRTAAVNSSIPKRRTVLLVVSMPKPPKLAFSCISAMRGRVILDV